MDSACLSVVGGFVPPPPPPLRQADGKARATVPSYRRPPSPRADLLRRPVPRILLVSRSGH
eukprot:5636807-Prymnesium_polylepis.1